MEAISILRDTGQRLQNELKRVTIQLSKNIVDQLNGDSLAHTLSKLKDVSAVKNSPAQMNKAAVETAQETVVEREPRNSKLKLVKNFSSENELKDLLMTMVNEQIEVKTSSGDISGELISVERDFIEVGHSVIVPLNRIEVVTQMTREDFE